MNMIKNTELPESYPCQDCQAGIVRPRYLTYFTWLNEELITVPNFPAWICDVCGKREYDQRAISWLSMLLNPNTGRRPEHGKNSERPRHQGDNAPPAAK
ncbi:MAG: YgiT-type zinc finger protein [Anaerolineae bacterium]|nr:YgiT-type zinc finger protein [Anaerolineae bacterium]